MSSGIPVLPPDLTSHGMGSRLALAAVNSVAWRRSAEPIDRWQGYDDVVDWVEAAGWLAEPDEIRRLARQDPDSAGQVFRRAVRLRETLFDLFSAMVAADPATAEQREQVQRGATRGLAALRLVDDTKDRAPGDGPAYALRWSSPSLDLPEQLVAVSAALLLAGPERASVKQCPGPRCGWVFLDESRNQSRRWCDPTLCGNRDRVHAHYVRTRSG